MEFIRCVFGDDTYHRVQNLNGGSLRIEAHRCSNRDFDIVVRDSEISRQGDISVISIGEVEAAAGDLPAVEKLMLSHSDRYRISVRKFSVKVSDKAPARMKQVRHTDISAHSTAPAQSFPSGHSYPPEDEWSIVFGCPIYKAFPSVKGLPVVLAKCEAKVATANAKRATQVFAVLIPMYLIFYESETSAKYSGSIFLSNAKIEVESGSSITVIKSNVRTTITFPKVGVMQDWSQRILYMINASATALENWRSQIQ